jgi:hypothetical protein
VLRLSFFGNHRGKKPPFAYAVMNVQQIAKGDGACTVKIRHIIREIPESFIRRKA